MQELNEQQTKKILLGILVYFDKFCKSHNLRYTLAYGTLLGAVRHHGFIPWDDDIDIEMPLKDYKKLVFLLNKQSLSNRYQLHDLSTENKYHENYYYPFAKLEDAMTVVKYFKTHDSGGAFIDIFPMTPLPKNRRKWYFYNKKARLLKVLLAGINGTNRSKIRNMISRLEGKLIDYRIIRNKLWKLAIKYANKDSSNYLVDGTWHDYKDKNFFPKEWFESYTYISFEDHKLSVIKKYMTVLKHDYHDWEKLPPISQRIPHHNYKLFFKE